MPESRLIYDQFKADILQWKNSHREEYNRFARLMTNGGREALSRYLPCHFQTAAQGQDGMGIVLGR